MPESFGEIEDKGPDVSTDALFDTKRYPINRRGAAAYKDLISSARDGLADQNCARLAAFIRPNVVERMQAEAAALVPQATYTKADLNPYFTAPPEGLPEDHPLRRLSPRRHGMVRGDRFARAGLVWAVFQNDDLCAFVADCLGYEKLYTYRDPFGCVNANIQPEGCEFAWHFDNNDFTVSFGLKQPQEGGVFEYVPDLRTQTDENFDEVKRVLDGDATRVRRLVLRPGDLQLFRGGQTLHRVTAPVGEDRLSLLLSYVSDPANLVSAETAIRLWGEAHPLHLHQGATERRA
ncbi:MAG: hypothetical protein R3322_09370 [Kiloniellales bacterium]|nr:hypothetical protein [Kiloniellales bacterium]